MKSFLVLTSLFIILAIGLSYDSLAYGTHPNSIEWIKLNKDTFDYGETIILTAQLTPPFSNEPSRVIQIYAHGEYLYQESTVNETGLVKFEFPLTNMNMGHNDKFLTIRFYSYEMGDRGWTVKVQHGDKTKIPWTLATTFPEIVVNHMKILETLDIAESKDNKEIIAIQATLTHFDQQLITMSNIFHLERLDIDKLQNSTTTIIKDQKSIWDKIKSFDSMIEWVGTLFKTIGFLEDDVSILQDNDKSMQKQIDLLKKQTKEHWNNGTKHHDHP